jgi:hypothetical protein
VLLLLLVARGHNVGVGVVAQKGGDLGKLGLAHYCFQEHLASDLRCFQADWVCVRAK